MNARDEPEIRVDVAYARPERQWVESVWLPAGSTVADAVRASGVAGVFPELDGAEGDYGIWGRCVADSEPVSAGDRVEIYRPLRHTPRESRRLRAGAARDPAVKGSAQKP